MKDMIITHAKDVDGVSPVILLKLLKREVDFYLLENSETDEKVKLLLEEDLTQYENIYITDLVLGKELYEFINTQNWKEKVHVFDHHISGEYANAYSFVTLNPKECATSLFYQYLKKSFNELETEKIEEYVQHVFNLDLWHWKEKKDIVAKQLGDLFEIYGNLGYIHHFVTILENSTIPIIRKEEEKLLKLEADRINRYFERKNEQLRVYQYQNYKMGVVFAEKYQSELGMLLQEANKEVDFIAMINIGGGVSLRTQKEDVDLSLIASTLGGGGHKKASGFGILEDQRVEIVKQIFDGAIEEK